MIGAGAGAGAIDEEESSEQSSDWDDWQDPEYIEEQRRALQDFSKKQREIKSQHAKKKKKGKKKKGKRGITGGDALDMDMENNDGTSQFKTIKDSDVSESLDLSQMNGSVS